ncbi:MULTISPECIES: Mut7-C RNAse domain-containing protein [unclassified Nocardiopsis]|uniref:Mut7-C RNAse domain-containing protein n=1 Tax=unclassified Nocardiopsis TaxID=2649073 RepID=UPI001357DBDB|nr:MULTISPECIES: Mut7-C RNAse domain-containing protein [unclassified Nocardiopsis]
MTPVTLELRFAPPLRFLLAPRHRQGTVHLDQEPTSTLGHAVQSLGVPLTEVGELRVHDRPATPDHRPAHGEVVDVLAHQWPQTVPFDPVRFLLDVHLGTLARRLRLLGVDTAYHNDRDDPSLVAQANDEERVLLTRDRGLLHRKNLRAGGHVRPDRPDDQLHEVLARFAPALRPWTRCPACNGLLTPVAKHQVQNRLEPGTRATQESFARCRSCDRVYWPGSHHARLDRIVRRAQEAAPR